MRKHVQFLGVAKLRSWTSLIHTYFHHWIEMWGWQRRMLFKLIYYTSSGVRECPFAWSLHTKSLCLALHKKQSPRGNKGVLLGKRKAVKRRDRNYFRYIYLMTISNVLFIVVNIHTTHVQDADFPFYMSRLINIANRESAHLENAILCK